MHLTDHPDDILERVRQFIQTHAVLIPGTCAVVAVSGGPDSVALLDLLHRLGNLNLHIAHLNHRLRPAADADAAFVQTLGRRYNLPVHTGEEEVHLRAKREKRSLEDAARQARREFLASVQTRVGASCIALGHTRSDQAETVLLRLLRGAGLSGLGAMRPVVPNGWVRPLLDISRGEIEAYVGLRHLETRTDETNADTHFTRNRIRHDLLPRLRTDYNPQIETVLARTADLLQTDENLLEILAGDAYSLVVCYAAKRKIILDVKRFFGYHISLQRRLIRMALFQLIDLADTAGYAPVERVLQAMCQKAGNTHIFGDLMAHKTGDLCILSRPATPYCIPVCTEGQTPIPNGHARLVCRVHKTGITAAPSENNKVFFDLDLLSCPLHLRPPRPGDRIQPFGMSGRRKISDLLIDAKMPRPLRDEVPLLIGSDNRVLWVVGLRRSGIAPVTSSTCRMLEMVYEGGWQHVFSHPGKRLS